MTLPYKAFPVSWDQFHRDTRALSWRIASLNANWRGIVAIARGGLFPAAIIARQLGIRVLDTVCIASYHNYSEQTRVDILKEISTDFLENQGEEILVIDDLTDTGKTIECLKRILPKAHYATVYSKPQGRPLIDTYVTEVSQDTWIYFPWDMGFTYQAPINKDHAG